ncbi:hypothetical protein [Sphingomonas sp.]|uniref:hypothetical protein n=1 Tax=Sphingomonas sp. TaxID=28214 RepID=UPI0035B14AA2
MNIGWLGLQHILHHGGSGYFPQRLVRDYLADHRLMRIAGAPEFSQPAYLVYASEDRAAYLDAALEAIRDLARHETALPPKAARKSPGRRR